MLNGFISVLVVFMILAVGFFFTNKKLWPENTNQVFSISVVQIAAPALAVTSIENRFTPELLHSSALNLFIIAASLFIMLALGKILAHVLALQNGKKAVFQVTFTFNNTMFIGLPIIQIIFGYEGLPFLFTFYLATIVLFWTIGAYTLSKASGSQKASFSVQKIFSPGLIGVIAGCVLVELQLPLPLILETALTYLGNLCVPLSLLVIGSNLSKSWSKGFSRITVDQCLIMLGKFVIHPLLVFLLFTAFGIGGLPLHVFILTAAMPCHAQTAILAQFYEVEGEYASNLVSLSTLISLVTIPFYANLLL
ncbi:AEC family transporter [Clostridium aminobutyricum]|uniref:AEC family transporter n=1 Tax=Clostridium aminobutyricum TaxID=33953 RepID=A0A939D7W0_CLOAM|nr:AEC family transporter [Clostridium aminobutyricum]MBN7773124.1 AEC family transporter [Clostridium aminobutyricum]